MEVGNSDIKAAQEEQEYHENRQAMLDQVQLQHPIAYYSLNLCKLNKKRPHESTQLSDAKEYRDFFGVSTDGFHPRRKAYLSALRDLVKGCSGCDTPV